MSKTILFKDEDELKQYIINFIQSDPAFVESMRQKLNTTDLYNPKINDGIVIPSYSTWNMMVEGQPSVDYPIRIDGSNQIKMRANELNVDKLFVCGKEIRITEPNPIRKEFSQDDYTSWV